MHISDISDETLMLNAQNGELDAIGKLYLRYSKKLFNFFLRLTANRETSSDLTQNVFYRILKYRNSYSSEHLFKTWMYQMARNCLTDHHEVNLKHPVIDSSNLVLSTILEDDAADTQAKQDVLLFKAIDNLPLESKELLVMSKFQGLKYEEISNITGDSVPNIKVKVHRTLIRLKELYFELENA
jgi:RNA polymerase sigma factor (sigma-70 family)